MSYETLIYKLANEIEDEAEQSREEYSPYSIIEKYFKKVHEATKKGCVEVVEDSGAYDGIKRTIIYRIGKL